jgi:hypothetical protein
MGNAARPNPRPNQRPLRCADGYTCIPDNRNVLGGQQGGQQGGKMWDQCGGQGGNCGSYICQDAPFAKFACPSGG